jgi:hypothetical protein
VTTPTGREKRSMRRRKPDTYRVRLGAGARKNPGIPTVIDEISASCIGAKGKAMRVTTEIRAITSE